VKPEYAQMSKKPPIGHRWIQKYTSDVYSYDHVIVNGRPQKPPRFYDKYLEKTNPSLLLTHKLLRQQKGKATSFDNTPARLKAREICTTAKFSQSKRKL
jgi:hypothetical protein